MILLLFVWMKRFGGLLCQGDDHQAACCGVAIKSCHSLVVLLSLRRKRIASAIVAPLVEGKGRECLIYSGGHRRERMSRIDLSKDNGSHADISMSQQVTGAKDVRVRRLLFVGRA